MRTAIVTGAGTGIGRAASLRLARDGYSVALVGRTLSKLEKVAAEIAQLNLPEAMAIAADVADSGQLRKMIEQVVAKWERVDVLVNNAGYAPLMATHQVGEDEWQKIIDTNLSSAFHGTRLVWPVMAKQGGGVIINISSMAARDPFPSLGAYGVAKAGVNMLTLATAREGAAVKIRVVGIAPAGVDTPMFRELFGEKISAQEILQPEDVAEVIASAVDGPLRHSSGETIYVHQKPA
jgi:NAD(P)-dependent dehydrogenase (short-subunit alcohol dehydrogenase family)